MSPAWSAEGTCEFTVLLSRRLVPRPDRHHQGARPVGRPDRLPGAAARRAPGRTTTVAGTDGSWQSRRSHVTAADLIAGQSEDRRLTGRAGGWQPVRGRGAWLRAADLVAVASGAPRRGDHRPLGDEAPRRRPSRRPRAEHQRLDTAGATSARPGRSSRSSTARRSTRPATSRPITSARRCRSLTGRSPRAWSTASISAGRDGDVFEPRHTTHGFRYVRVEGHPGDLAAGDVTGVVVHTDLPRHRLVYLQRRPGQRAARGGGVELARQRLRHPHRLPAP